MNYSTKRSSTPHEKRIPNLKHSLNAFVLAFLVSLSCNISFCAEIIRLSDVSSGCFQSGEAHSIFTQTNNVFISESRTIPAKLIEDLRNTVLLEGKKPQKLNLEDLGITPEAIAKHRGDIIEAALQNDSFTPKLVPPEMEHLFNYPNIRDLAVKSLNRFEGSSTRVNFRFELQGTERITIESNHACPWMLPWKISIGNNSFDSYSLEIPKHLSKIADPKGPNYQLLNGSKYWKSEFWTDQDVWDSTIGRQLEEYHSKKIATSLEGYKEFQNLFILNDAHAGNINSQPFSLFLKLQTKKPSLVDSIWWFNHIEAGKPIGNWNQFLKLYETCSTAASKHKWLSEWKGNEKGREIEGAFSGLVGHDETNLKEYVLPAWIDAGCKGLPEFRLLLRHDRSCSTVFISSKEEKSLVLNTDKRTGSHWLDKEEVFFHPRTPNYLLVNADGSFQRKTIKRAPSE